MRNYITGVFDSKAKAYEALHALWQLDRSADITVHGTAVVHRDASGHFLVDTKETMLVRWVGERAEHCEIRSCWRG